MGQKPKAGGTKGKMTDAEQSARFIEAARQAGVDESGVAFEEAFRKITRAPPHGRDKAEAAPCSRKRPGDKPT